MEAEVSNAQVEVSREEDSELEAHLENITNQNYQQQDQYNNGPPPINKDQHSYAASSYPTQAPSNGQ